jgi:general secretion pathway protein L
MFEELFRWWAARMAELVPAGLSRRRNGLANAVIVTVGETPTSPATLLLRRNRQETLRGSFVAGVPGRTDRRKMRAAFGGLVRQRTVLLRPPPGALLERRLDLPLAAQPELRRVIGYEMDRVTPFEADEVFWTWTIEARDRARGRLQVRLSLVPKAPLLPLLAALDEAGLSPTALEVAHGGAPPRLIPLHQEAEWAGWPRRTTIALAATCGVLALTAALLPFVQQSLALAEVEERIAALQPEVSQVQELRRRIAAESAGRDAVSDERARIGNTVEILAAATDLLPDDTFLTDLSLRQRRLTISGQSGAAPRLIAALASDPAFRNPAFAAPVTRNAAARTDVFSIRTELGP